MKFEYHVVSARTIGARKVQSTYAVHATREAAQRDIDE